MGPTASGKTGTALDIAARFPVDIISVDSALVYRGMDIGTAKPARDVLQRVPHRLIDILDPEETYSAGDFVRDAQCAIGEIHAAGRIPLLVGGTMLYFRSLIDGIAQLPDADQAVRSAIDLEAGKLGWPAMHEELRIIDPVAAERINRNDSQRIQRALEVHRVSGRTISDWQNAGRESAMNHDYLKIALIPDSRKALHERIAARLELMMEQGFVAEVRRLMERPGLTAEHSSMRAVGYRQIWAYLEGNTTLEDAEFKALAATRQLCKRQLTWLRSEPDLQVFDPLEGEVFTSISSLLMERAGN